MMLKKLASFTVSENPTVQSNKHQKNLITLKFKNSKQDGKAHFLEFSSFLFYAAWVYHQRSFAKRCFAARTISKLSDGGKIVHLFISAIMSQQKWEVRENLKNYSTLVCQNFQSFI